MPSGRVRDYAQEEVRHLLRRVFQTLDPVMPKNVTFIIKLRDNTVYLQAFFGVEVILRPELVRAHELDHLLDEGGRVPLEFHQDDALEPGFPQIQCGVVGFVVSPREEFYFLLLRLNGDEPVEVRVHGRVCLDLLHRHRHEVTVHVDEDLRDVRTDLV